MTRPKRISIWGAIVDIFSVDGENAFPPISLDAVDLITVELDLQGWKRILCWLCNFKIFMVKSAPRQEMTAHGLLTLISNNVVAVDS